jgi:hypothetical protein
MENPVVFTVDYRAAGVGSGLGYECIFVVIII